jgi:hypothetical protein
MNWSRNIPTRSPLPLEISKGESTYFRSIAGAYLPYRRGFDRVVIIITNHSHDDTGDMYLGPNLCTSVDDVSILI